ncbi:MAG: ChaB family protein [Chloroflexi bacterium]|nr:ChaB family protein [Chloroflexota bacterium]
MPARDELPATLKRSPKKAQETWIKTHDNAVEQYGEGERAHRTAFASLKHTYEKVEDRWARKKEKGPSDPRSKMPTRRAARGEGETFGGVDLYGNTKPELYERARQLGVEGRSGMTKVELARAIGRKQG